MKKCTKCGVEKPATREFFHYESSSSLRLRGACISCVLEYAKKLSAKKVADSPDDRKVGVCWLVVTCSKCGHKTPYWFKISGRNQCQACSAIRKNPKLVRDDFQTFRNRLLLAAESKYLRKHTNMNRCQSCGKLHQQDNTRKKRWIHVCYECERLTIRRYRQLAKAKMKSRIAGTLRKAMKKGGNSPTVYKLLGYTIGHLREHLQKQFLPGMRWENMDEWHIDHIIPQASFNLSDPEQWKKCWCLSNLRPMWATDNVAKSDKRLFLI